MASIGFGGDPESFMEAPRMENKGLSDSLGFSPIAAFLDLIGVHRQVAKEPKVAKDAGTPAVNQPVASGPTVLQDVETALAQVNHRGKVSTANMGMSNTSNPPAGGMLSNPHARTGTLDPKALGPMTPWGQRWLESNKPLLSIDPDSIF